MTIRVLRMTVLTVLGYGLFAPPLHASGVDGVANVGQAVTQPPYGQTTQYPYYVATGQPYGHQGHNHWGQHRQQPNPTYWTWMPLPFHGCCDYCADPGCPGKKGLWTFPFVRWVLDPDYYAVAPDYGWSPPARVPVRRQNIPYQNYVPQNWTGQQANGNAPAAQGRPIIATPTDTTQLGYYYQHVPTWQSMNNLPVPPDPRQWHTRPCIPDQNMSYVRWMRLRNIWTPIQNIPDARMGIPTPVESVLPQQELPAPPVEGPPIPVIPMPPANAPEALNFPEISAPIRRVGA
jgi:hypothetical protein